MTNKEILKADLLDIVFENRNKDYGAYALRRGYNHRLLAAIGAAMSVILLFIFIGGFGRKNTAAVPVNRTERIVEIKEVNLAKEKPKEPEKTKEQPKPATEKYVSKIAIKPDDKVKEKLPDIADLDNKLISDKKQVGTPDDGIPKKTEPVVTGTGNTGGTTEPINTFKPEEKDPQFPGGPEALKKFLANNLETPGELQDGEKKTVLIRFKVDKDGAVTTFEIVTSGGNEFDREVVRVCKKMPHWTPALQNGINVPVSYMLPVTFIGVEQ